MIKYFKTHILATGLGLVALCSLTSCANFGVGNNVDFKGPITVPQEFIYTSSTPKKSFEREQALVVNATLSMDSDKRSIDEKAELFYALGTVYDDLGLEGMARYMMMNAIVQRPGFARPYELLGIYFFQDGRVADACDALASAIELDDSNMSSFYSTLTLNENNVNIVMLHGQIGSSNKDINLLKLRNKNIDYLALGHIHSYSTGKIDDRAIYVYSGCLEPRGFDELNEKGFVEIEIIDNKLTHKFVSFSQRVIKEEQVDISLMDEAYDISEKIKKEININLNNIYRFKLIGETDIDVSDMLEDIEQYLKDQAYFINVVDKTSKVFDIHKYDYDLSLKGEFVRTVYQNEDYTEEEKIKIISLGLKALDKKGVE